MTTAPSSLRRWTTRIGFVVMMAAMIQAPLLYGGATTRSVGWLLLIVSLALLLAPPARKPGVHSALMAIGMATTLWAVTMAAQWLGTPSSVQDGSGVWSEAHRALALSGPERLPISMAGLLEALARAGLVATTLAAAVLYGQDRDRAIQALRWLVAAGVVTIVLGMALHLIQPGYVFWQKKVAYLTSFTGSFIHRGAAGAWQSLIAITAALLAIRVLHRHHRQIATESETRITALLRAILQDPLPLLVYGLAFVIAVVGLLLTQSRAALVMLGLQVMILLLLLPALQALNWRFVSVISVILAILFAGLFDWAGANVTRRLGEGGLFDEGRWDIWVTTIDAIRARPWLGYGAGSFPDGFAMMRGPDLVALGQIQSAHSLPLELAFELGLPTALALCLAWVGLAAILNRALLRNRRLDIVVLTGALAAIGASVVVSIDVVSSTFGYILPMTALVGLALAQRHFYAQSEDDDSV